MIRLIYLLHCSEPPEQPIAERLAAGLLQLHGVSDLQINLNDAAVAPAASLAVNGDSPLAFNLLVKLSLSDGALKDGALSAEMESILAAAASSVRRFVVHSREPLACPDSGAARGQRSAGFSQIALLTLPAGQALADWRAYWLQ